MKTHDHLLENLLSRTREVVADRQLSLRDVATSSGIPFGTLSHLWYGTVRNPRWSVVVRLQAFLEAPPPPRPHKLRGRPRMH